MRIEKQVTFWLAALAIFGLMLWSLSGVLMPFVTGLVLAYLFDPIADRLEKLGLNRLLATTVVIGLCLFVFIIILVTVVPFLVGELGNFIQKLPGYITRLQTLATELAGLLASKLDFNILEKLGLKVGDGGSAPKVINQFFANSGEWLGKIVSSIWSGGRALIGLMSLLVITPVVAFYMLVDWDRMVTVVDSWIPIRQRETVRGLAREIDGAIAAFIRGQTLVCVFLGLWYGIGLSMVGLNFGFLIGVVAGFLSFIPYVGTLTALVLSIGVAIVQGWPSLLLLAMAMTVIGIGQLLESYVLTPKLVGKAIGLHPVWLMFALIAFGYLFGFTGLIVAVPVAAAIGVLTRFALRQYKASPLYQGGGVAVAAPVVSEEIETGK